MCFLLVTSLTIPCLWHLVVGFEDKLEHIYIYIQSNWLDSTWYITIQPVVGASVPLVDAVVANVVGAVNGFLNRQYQDNCYCT